ncbi:CYTH domain-containing protein [Marinirhabdus gelatinilytica]|uniref:CYTH domain-containing protein n=1 Tax=Marinirhabdus gelatinilytica TaxID=1703343 RepID=A0A370QJ65_9FLAO|nr:CYTH domain-containing protein [Marinirhabdus gelatinilytica]RDK88395.1 CYTH domain-containing protein [Marinirhabdus gelatinilytica]
MLEIERKFLVKNNSYKTEAVSKKRIVQGFLNTHPERTVRVRIKGEQAFLTVKGKSNAAGTIRLEWESEITVQDAEALLALCEDGQIDKVRYEIPVKDHIFEVDEFFGNNKGLTLAEVELKEENEPFEKPDWLGDEVTGEVQYYNSQLTKKPFTLWK